MTDVRRLRGSDDGEGHRDDHRGNRHASARTAGRGPAAGQGFPRHVTAPRSPVAGLARPVPRTAASPALHDRGGSLATRPVAGGRVPPRLGELLVRAGVIDDDQLAAALADQRRARRPLGEILVEHGVPLGAVTKALLKQIRSELNRGRLGELLVELGMATPTQIGEGLYRQRTHHVSLGKALIDAGVITLSQLELALEEQHRRDQAAGEA